MTTARTSDMSVSTEGEPDDSQEGHAPIIGYARIPPITRERFETILKLARARVRGHRKASEFVRRQRARVRQWVLENSNGP